MYTVYMCRVFISIALALKNSKSKMNIMYMYNVMTCVCTCIIPPPSISKVFNLGRPTTHYPPVVSPDGNAVQITYVGGDTCDHTHKKFTTKILLVCSNNSGSVSVCV